jgi:hypothetical protein
VCNVGRVNDQATDLNPYHLCLFFPDLSVAATMQLAKKNLYIRIIGDLNLVALRRSIFHVTNCHFIVDNAQFQ